MPERIIKQTNKQTFTDFFLHKNVQRQDCLPIYEQRSQFHLQDVSHHPNSPHVSAEADCFVVDHLWGTELWCPKQQFDLLVRIELTRQAKVNDLDVRAVLRSKQDVLWLKKVKT